MRATKILMIGLAAMIAAATTGAHAAAPSTGSPLVGAFCSASAPIVGVGASFATNAHNNAFIPAYDANCPAGAGKVTYTGGGSGVGKQAACNRSNLLAGSDDPLTPTEYAQYTSDTGSAQDPNRPCAGHSGAQASPLQHIPLAVGAVTASYNLDRDALGNTICGIKNEQLKLRSTELALIFSGLVTN